MKNRELIIQENIANIKKRIAAAAKRSKRRAQDITLVAVTKNVAIEDIRIAIQAGIKILGENKVQEAKTKFMHIGPAVTWHMLGHMQTNKIRAASAIFDMVQSVDSKKVSDLLDREATRLDREISVLVEVNIGAEETKFGIPIEDTTDLILHVSQKPNLRLRGLMCMAPYVSDPELTRPFFHEMSMLFNRFRAQLGESWKILSMGMTNDFEVAIEEGATLVRIGTGLFHTPDLRRED
ncbi:YggS family pyridoxal phosphate-dependent enzyme [bacterium]|nr:YggS family pyridoxal phosphate-dependent enzyme [bacterium]